MRIFWLVLFLSIPVLGTVMFIAAAMSPAWLPENISNTGGEIDHLFYLILGITGFFFVVTEVLLVYAMFNSTTGENAKGTYTHGNHFLEIGWTVMTAGILLFVALYQMPAWAKAKYRSQMPQKNPDALVTASQFLWQVRYPNWDADAEQPRQLGKTWTRNPPLHDTFEKINELHVPLNEGDEQVLIHLTTRDVIHSFWLPNVRIKQDALPGHIIPVWFDVRKPGTYEWVCAELCGWGHYRMRAKLVVHTKDEYRQWLEEETRRQTAAAVDEK